MGGGQGEDMSGFAAPLLRTSPCPSGGALLHPTRHARAKPHVSVRPGLRTVYPYLS